MKVKQFVKEIFAQMKRDWRMPVTEHQIYDTTERVIGTYMGKPLYRKVVDCGYGPNKAQKTVALGFHAERYLSIVGTFQGSDFSGPLNNANDSNVQYQFALDVTMSTNGDSIVLSSRNMDRSTAHVFVTLEYTKTTDTASDSKVPFEPLTEYSTEERMIGYWIDGKPLYRRVIELTSPISLTANTWGKVALNSFDVGDRLVFCDMIAHVNNEQYVVHPLAARVDRTEGALFVWITVGLSGIDTIISEYTKTTD